MEAVALPRQVLTEEEVRFCEMILSGHAVGAAFEESGVPPPRSKPLPHVAGRRLLKRPKVRNYLALRRMEMRERNQISPDKVVMEWSHIAFFDPAELVLEDIDSPSDIAALPEHVRKVIAGWSWDKEGRFIVKLASKQRALDALAKHLGLFQQDRRNVHDQEVDLLRSAFWRYVFALHTQEGVPISDAYRRAQSNPEVVQAWGIAQGLLKPPETEAAEGEIVAT